MRIGWSLLPALLVALILPHGLLSAREHEPPGLDPHKAITQYGHDVWLEGSGMPQTTVNAILQTRDGYLWLGTQEGLIRFDGVRFSTFNKRNTPALRNNFVVALCEDRDGALWVGTYGGGLIRIRDGRFESYTKQNGLFSDIVYAIHQDRGGTIWIGTEGGGLNRFRNGTLSSYGGGPLSRHGISTIEESEDGHLWIGTFGGGLYELNGAKPVIHTTREGLAHDSVRAVHRGRSGRLWIGTSGGGLSEWKDGKFQTHTTRDGLSNDVVRAVYEDRRGSVWIGTDFGLTRFAGGRFSTYTPKEGLSGDIVSAIYEDREGSLWVGTDGGGLNHFRDGKFVTYTTLEGLSNDVVRSIYDDGKGSVWIGTFGGLDRLEGDRLTAYTTRNGLSSNVISAVFGDREGNLWIGTRGGGLNRWRDGKITVYTPKDGLSYDAVRVIDQDRAGDLWIGTDGGGLSRFHDGKFTNYTTADGLSSNFIRSVHEDRNGVLWIGTEQGLSRFENGRFSIYSKKNGLSSDVVLAIHEDREGSLWLGTYGGGLNRLHDARVTVYAADSGLPDDSIFFIADDSRGNFWMSSDQGIFSVRREELEARARGRGGVLHPTVYGTADGLKSAKCNGGSQPSGWKSRDGRLWFPTMKGVAAIDPERIRTNDLPPPVVIEKVTIEGVEIVPRGRLVLSPGKRNLEFDYTALSLLAPDKVRFRYKLEGFDREWIEAGTRRAAYYTNLPPGNYRFRVSGSNNDGVWNERGATIDFYHEPFFYQTPPFYLLCGLAAILAGFGILRIRVSRLRARERELVELVSERTKSLLEEKEKVEHANEALRQANQLKMELLSVAAHDLRNPLQAISGFAQILSASAAGDSSIAKKADVICRASEEMVHLINDLLESVQIESGTIEIERRLVDMGRVAQAVVAANTPAAERKNQQIVVECGDDCVVTGDENRLFEAMENLLSNAIKYSPRGKPVRVTVCAVGPEVRFAVKDEGPGLTVGDKQRVFGRFQRLSARPTGGESSTGLGLSIVKQFIEMQGGRIWVESEPGKGSTFTFAMPAAVREEVEAVAR